MKWILWLIAGSALLHIIEEYYFGWLQWVQGFVPGVTVNQFIIVNSLFLVLCIFAAYIGKKKIVLGLSVASLIFINSFFHIVPAAAMGVYSPGMVTAIFLYIPLSVLAYVHAFKSGLLGLRVIVLSILLGTFWHSVPILYQQFRLYYL